MATQCIKCIPPRQPLFFAEYRGPIRQLREKAPDTTVFVGGAVLTPEYAEQIGADFYAKDAKRSVEIANAFFEKQ